MSYLVVLRLLKRTLLFFLILCLSLHNTVVYAAPLPGQADSLIPQCEDITESQLRVDLNRIIQDFLSSQTNVNFGEIVNQQWRVLSLDSVIDSEIDNAVLMVGNNTDMVNRFKSSWIPSKAEELAGEVTQIAFNSTSLKNKLNQLSKNVADGLADKLEVTSAKSSSYAIDCLQQFVGRQYSRSFVNIFSEKIKASELDPDALGLGTLKPGTLQVINRHKFGIAGGAILATYITARIRKKVVGTVVDRIFQQVGERLLGRLGSGAIPFIGEFLGAIWIGSDLIKSFDGALPEIQRSLKLPEIKQTIQKEIARTIEEEIRTETSQIAREVSNDVYAEWLDFQKDYQSTLSLAGELPEFKDILSRATDLSKISLLVGIALNNMGRSQLVASIKDGTFEKALSLPESSYKIIEATRNLPSLIAWTNLAANQIEDVVRLELYKNLSPDALDHQLLTQILALDDSSTISKVSLLDVPSIRRLMSISRQNLVALSTELSPDDLERLAGYLNNLKQPQINQLVKFLLNDDPSIIKNASVMAHIVQSHNISTAIEFWESEENLLLLLSGVTKLFSGSISWQLVADKFGIPVALFLTTLPVVFLLAILLSSGIWLYRQLRQLRKVQKQQPLGESNAD